MADASRKILTSEKTLSESQLPGDFGQGNDAVTASRDSDFGPNQSLAYTITSRKLQKLLRGGIPSAAPASVDAEKGTAIGSANDDLSSTDCPRYQIGKELGSGGMGVVYEGWDVQLQRRIAIKIIRDKEHAKPKWLLRFFREARIAARMQHPSILSIHEFDIDSEGRAFIVMGLLDGVTLRTVLAEESLADGENRIRELPSLLACFLKICQAIAYAHSCDIIHRDLKPLNIMVGRYGVVTVLDWGLAKIIAEADEGHDHENADPSPDSGVHCEIAGDSIDEDCLIATRSGEMIGTPGYISPEQARGEIDRIDKRSDVFSLGAILCEILTGRPPYVAPTVKTLRKQASTANLNDAFSGLDRCGAPPILVNLAKQCLSPDPSNRPCDASEIVTAITAYLDSGQLRAEQELVRFFDLSMDLFCIANTSGYFYRLNENFQRVLGYTTAELTSCQFVDFVHPEDRAKTLVEIEKLARGEPAFQFINRYRHKDGHYVWLEWMARSVPEEASVYAVARDVTERIAASEARKKLEAEHHLLGRLVDATEDAIICKDPNGFIRSWNATAEALYGYSADEIIGKHISILLKPEQLREELAVVEEVRRRGSIPPFQTVRVGKDGITIDVSISMSLLSDAQGNIISVSRGQASQQESTTAGNQESIP